MISEWMAWAMMEIAALVVLILLIFHVPLADWLMRRRLRKREQYEGKLRQKHQRKYQTVGHSRWHGKN
jgi:uncharacterized membrane protein YcjF (UPF0283 family)